jgi:glycine/D-amino acid oxidase-like deaminating enzyme
MQTAEVVIIGGGIVGSSIAYHLTAAGCKDVLVIERETAQGKGSTGKSMGGVRAQFSTPVNIQMSLYSIPFYASFDERQIPQATVPWAICSAPPTKNTWSSDELPAANHHGPQGCTANLGGRDFTCSRSLPDDIVAVACVD